MEVTKEIPKGALESQEETLEWVKQRMMASGKTATIIKNLSMLHPIEFRTEGLGKDEWWFENAGINPKVTYGGLNGKEHIVCLVRIFDQMRKEGLIQSFDFGIPYYYYLSKYYLSKHDPEGTPLGAMEDVVAIFLTSSPFPKRGEVNARFWELKKEVGLRK